MNAQLAPRCIQAPPCMLQARPRVFGTMPDEDVVPDVKLTRSKDGSSGRAIFVFQAPSVFEASSNLGDITGLYMLDDEGEISTVDVAAKFVNGKPDKIEATHTMRSAFEWDRFMRFMERYADKEGMGFQKVGS